MKYYIFILLTIILTMGVCKAGSYTHSKKTQSYKIYKEKKEKQLFNKSRKIIVFGIGFLLPVFVLAVFALFKLIAVGDIIFYVPFFIYLWGVYLCFIALFTKLLLPSDNYANWFLIAAGIIMVLTAVYFLTIFTSLLLPLLYTILLIYAPTVLFSLTKKSAL